MSPVSARPTSIDLAGGLVRLKHSSAVAKAQHAAAAKIAELTHLGVAADQASGNLVRAASANVGQHADALAAMATGLGANVDVYA